MSLERKRGFLRPDEDGAEVKPEKWGLPDYTSETNKDAKETAFNYDPGWIPNFDEPSAEAPIELTESAIEEIKKNAHQEGYLQGQEAGFNAGYEKGKEQGLNDGHAEGLDLGKTEGIQEGQAFIKQQVEHFMNLANQFAQPLELMNAQVEKQLVEMVLTLTKEVVHVEVQTNPQIILDTIKESVEALPISGHSITLKLNPEDVTIIKSAYGEEELDCRNWILLSEPSLNRGDIQIEAGESSVSYKIEERIRSVIQSFCGVNRFQGSE
ncbi:flagellar assembly protein FliH [Vibrio algarum]|uniref:Flagellar assembly protein FliH n=1 Tax=Vibrio algarum TaxID=3020714 RepID=A0ABT4YP27_9VIBR|nr:flagellar assembly protein FliH [Vibrio sp. KJ40-1]MDB1123301.1 flagellar assembly protein FliH [Vibrio sp. KJ40-1]